MGTESPYDGWQFHEQLDIVKLEPFDSMVDGEKMFSQVARKEADMQFLNLIAVKEYMSAKIVKDTCELYIKLQKTYGNQSDDSLKNGKKKLYDMLNEKLSYGTPNQGKSNIV